MDSSRTVIVSVGPSVNEYQSSSVPLPTSRLQLIVRPKRTRARQIADRLTQSPPFSTVVSPPWADPMFHTPGWVGTMTGTYDVMDKAIDPKIAEGLAAAWRARDALALPSETVDAIAAEIAQVAHGPFFRFPNVRLNQINWPLELAAYDALVTGQGDLLRQEAGVLKGDDVHIPPVQDQRRRLDQRQEGAGVDLH